MAEFDEVELSGIRRRLMPFCYQMLGSPFEAEDAVQDAMERIWRARHSFDPERASIATWAYRIARNVCLDRLREAPRRPLPRDLQEPGIEIGAPLVPAFDVPWLTPAPTGWLAGSDVETVVERRSDVRLAVTAMLQSLSPLQRGAFVLRDLVGLSAVETAETLEVSVASANSALQRARVAISTGARRPHTLAPTSVERYARAIERADVAALASLVADDLVFEMPPVPAWSRGRDTYRDFMVDFFARRGEDWETAPISANGQPGILLYRLTADGRRPHTVQIFDGDASGMIAHVLVYQDPRLFALFENEFSPGR
ncbi:RNA polymerase sigma-70 factor (ECF subfamily) [Microbacterium sp. BE35]|uniref:RNA polymerase subunit sigma-70 n=1 Tax=Microbacterium sp. BE35 TaxID=2817773 RepID=UPI002865FA16|nr:RNA polymerase subunit sigma-70 [Microbacterium sp. BE35]MDR7190511.1 RNA polymerase sigma-70 factor (ECF subfamily) [Microbacterium sp. BE35]